MSSLLALAFLIRALVPQGYMPTAGQLFSLQICYEGLPASFLPASHHHHHHHHQDGPGGHDSLGTDHCVFGSAPCAGPAPALAALSTLQLTVLPVSQVRIPAPIPARRMRDQQPRAPPTLA